MNGIDLYTLVGFVGATASFGWFIAMTLQQVAVVKAAFAPLKPNIVGSYDIVLVCRTQALTAKSDAVGRQLKAALETAGIIKQ